QSHLDEIDLLPCLPKAWPTGSIRGMKLRGGFTIDFQWKNGALEKATLKAGKDNECRIRVAGKVRVESDGRLIPSVVTDKGLVVFQTLAGKTYALIPFK
ncbi:MAG: glycoside hydrolase family 95 protein, partial [Lentisphaeraceae bacterium]|nr:glycoside hydrolase family 95 protein [Lentisphaeraceae bacterium]